MSCDPTTNDQPVAHTSPLLACVGNQLSRFAPDPNQDTHGNISLDYTNVYAAGRLIATYDQTGKGLHFYQDDPLGTRRSQSDPSGVQELTCSSLPFGDALSCTGPGADPTEQHFTGKERDSESGNDYFGARNYSSSMGRWLWPDWSAHPQAIPYVDMENPQSLNLYGYVLNNPLTSRDPDGHSCDPDYDTTDSKTGAVTVHAGQCSLDWWDFPGHLWVGMYMMATANTGRQTLAGAAHIAYAYAGGLASEWAVGEIIPGIGKIIRIAGGKIVVERVMSMAELEATESTGLLRGGREGTHFVTDSAPDSAAEAQSSLALDNTPTFKVQMEVDGSNFSPSSTVEPTATQPGGGTERTATGNVSVKLLNVQALK